MLLVTAASLLDLSCTGPVGFEIPYGDKLGHMAFYGGAMVLALLAIWQRTRPRWPFRKAALVAFFSLLGYGLLMEGLQEAMGHGRTAEWGDVLANITGLLGGLASTKVLFYALKWLNWGD